MSTEYYALVSATDVLGILRWIVAILLTALVIICLIRQVKTKKSFSFVASFVSSLVLVPFLLLAPVTVKIDPGTTPEPTPVNPVPHVEPEPEPIPEPGPNNIEPVTPPKVNPEDNTASDTPDEPDEPEVSVEYTVIHRQQHLEDDEYTTIESETKTGIAGKTATPATKAYTGFVAPAAITATIAEDGSTEIVYNYNRELIALVLEDADDTTSSLPAGNYKYGTKVELTAKDRAGYVFANWSNGKTAKDITIELTEATSIKPIYTPNTYLVNFDKNNGSATGSMGAQTLTYDEAKKLSKNKFKLEGYSFNHWNTESNDTGTSYANEESVKNLLTEGEITLYAFWSANTDTVYTVNHYKQNIGGGDNYTLTRTENKTGTTDTMVTPDRESYTGFTAPAAQTKKITGDGHMVIDYYYARNQYTVTFGSNAAQISSDVFTNGEKYYYGQTGTLTAGNKTGYTFTSWTDGNSNASRSFMVGAEDATIGVNYRANNYTVIFHANYEGSSATANQSFAYDQAATALSANGISRVGYNLDHWSINADDSGQGYGVAEEVQNLTAVDGDEFHLYAQWTARDDTPYMVYHQTMTVDGQSYGRFEYIQCHGTSDSEVTPAVKTIPGFNSPLPQTVKINADGSTEVYYRYVRQKRTLTIQDEQFVTTETPSGDYFFNTYIEMTAKDREGYTFIKWTRNDETNKSIHFNLSDNTTIRPVYAANTYNIIFHKNAGEDPEVTTEQSRTYDDTLPFTLNANTFSREGYRFVGWATTPTGAATYSDEHSIATELSTGDDVNFYAVWQRQYTVSFSVNGGESATPSDIIIDAGSTIANIPADATWTGYSFDGWWAGDVKLGSSTIIDQNYIFFAHWIKHIDNSDVTVSPTTISLTRGENETISVTTGSNTWPLETYTVGGYDDEIIAVSGLQVNAIKAGETSIVLTGATSGRTITIPVEVLLPRYTITFDPQNETSTTTRDVEEGTQIGALPEVSYDGHTFDGWFTENGTEPIDATYVVTQEETIYAHWTEIPPEPTYVCKEAEELHTATCASASGKGCKAAINSGDPLYGGTIANNIITYGNLATSRSPKVGDAYDCDVSGHGDFKRFYVLAKDSEKVRFVYSTNYKTNQENIADIAEYNDALDYLPTEEQWTNPNFIKYDDNKITRFPMYDDVIAACSISGAITSGKPTNCLFLLENTTFEKQKTSAGPRSGIWIYKHEDKLYRIQAESLAFGDVTNPSSGPSSNGARPVIQVPLNKIEPAEPAPKHTITFDSQGGSPIDPIEVDEDAPIESLPTPEKELHEFSGWFKATDWAEEVKAGDYVTEDIVLYAKWTEINVVAKVENDPINYDSLQAAISAVPTTGEKTKVKLYQSVTENITIQSSQNVELNLQENTLACATGNSVKNAIKNYGKVEITNGYITCDTASIPTIENIANAELVISGGQITTTKANAVINKGSLVITGGVVSNSNAQGVINNESGATLLITGGQINANGVGSNGRQAIYNDGGTATIDGDATLTSKANARAAVHNKNNGTLNILGGTIVSEGAYGVFVDTGTVNIGVENGRVDTSKPQITGKTYGVVGHTEYNFYDGIIKGETYSIGNANRVSSGNPVSIANDDTEPPLRIADIEDGATLVYDTDGSYKTLTLSLPIADYQITFDANGGTTPSPSSITVAPGSPIGDNFPSTSRTSYNLIGWFTDSESGEEVDENTVPTGDDTYYAHWEHDDTIVEHNTQSEAVQNYFANIDTMANDSEDDFLLAMKSNFDSHNCKISNESDIATSTTIFPQKYRYDDSGTVYCDKPTAYDTGVNNINVYLSDESKTKGAEATYLSTANGKITNMIPGTIYRWESADDPTIYGFVKATGGENRLIDMPTARNVRDLGGLTGSLGTIKYGRLVRGEKLGSGDVDALAKLGITMEYDLRGTVSTPNTGSSDSSKYKTRYTVHYNIDPTDNSINSNNPYAKTNYDTTRDNLAEFMQDVIDGKNIYFHCSHGADRTGTIAYLAEGLLGIDFETRKRDYELTSFSGRADRTRYYKQKSTSTSGEFDGTKKFVYMTDSNQLNLQTTAQIETWFKAKLTTQAERDEADALIEAFRAAMLEGYGQ